MKEKQSMVFNYEWLELFEDFSDEEIGQLTVAIMKYDKTGEDTAFSDRGMKSVFKTMKKYVDLNKDKYEDKCRKMSENGKKGGRPTKEETEEKSKKAKAKFAFSEKAKKADTDSDSDTDTDTDIMTDSDFIDNNNIYNNIHSVDNIQGQSGQNVPSQDQVRNYFLKHKQTTHEADNFFNYYAAQGWTLNGGPIKFWARLADKWISNIRAPVNNTQGKNTLVNFHQRNYSQDEWANIENAMKKPPVVPVQ